MEKREASLLRIVQVKIRSIGAERRLVHRGIYVGGRVGWETGNHLVEEVGNTLNASPSANSIMPGSDITETQAYHQFRKLGRLKYEDQVSILDSRYYYPPETNGSDSEA